MLIFLCLSCQKEPIDPPSEPPTEQPVKTIPPEAVEFLEFETQTTHSDSLSLYASDQDKYTSFKSLLNDEEVDLFSSITLREAGYYELKVNALTDTDSIDLYFQFVILDSERGEAEWGLKKFTPKEIEDKPFALSELDFFYPKKFPKDLSLPLIFSTNAPKDKWEDYYAHLSIDGHLTTIKRGIGSFLLPPDRSASNLQAILYGEIKNLDIIDSEPNYIQLDGTIESNTVLEEEGHYHITSDLTISNSITLQIPKGCIMKIDEGINIYNNGHIIIQGSATQPIIFACSESSSHWGGFISIGAGTSIEVEHAIFTQSGFHDEPPFQYGHAKRQALFYQDKSELIIRNAYAIDNIGQIFFLLNHSILTLENTLIQRAKTAGDILGSDLVISDCTFTDFPEYSSRYVDDDNDCIYLNETDAVISNSTFMWSKDDGIDSGASGRGEVQVSNCYFEGIPHEALALSSGGMVTKNHEISNSVFRNNGQGVELGYSSPNHKVIVTDCHFEENLIGVRYGDNYNLTVSGHMELIDCSFDANIDKDIWNFVRSEWSAIDENLVF